MIRRRKEPNERPPQDHSYRCSTCALNYWDAGVCRVCKGTLSPISNQPPTEDLEYHIALALGETPDADDKVYGWRVRQLVFAGAPYKVAEEIALDREIDLHKAVDLFQKAGPKLAEAILL